MKKIFLSLILILAAVWTLSAAPAYKGRIIRTQPDGSTIVTYLHGDEFGHWVTDESGTVLEQDEDGWWRPSFSVSPQAISQQAGLRRAAANRHRRAAAQSSNNFGSPLIPVILLGFKDKAFSKSASDFDAMLNKEGYSANSAVGSVYDYFKENSQGAFTPHFEVLGPVRLDTTMAYYGANNYWGDDQRPEMALVHAVKKLDDEVDFSRYDNDGDGQVDFIMFYFAGFDEAQGGSTNCIWSHAWSLSNSSNAWNQREYDGVYIEDYFCTAELYGSSGTRQCRIGTTCHEFSHTLGLPDFYDADYSSNGTSANTYSYDLMSDGSYNADSTTPPYLNAEEVWEIGWLSSIPEITETGPVNIGAVNYPGASSYSARKLPAATSGEYFIFEVRGGERWDAPLREGMLIYHVDRSSGHISAWDNNTVNCYSSHPCCYLIPATNPTSLSYFDYRQDELIWPRSGVTSYVPTDWNGANTEWFVDGITYANGRASWEVKTTRSMEATGYSYIADPGEGNYHAGDSFPLTLVAATGDKAPAGTIQWSLDGDPVSGTSVTLPAGRHTLEASFTTSKGTTKKISLDLDVH